MRLPRRALPALLVLWLVGCAHTFDATTLGVAVTVASPAGQPAQGDRFSVRSRAVFGFWGLLKFREPSLRRALAAQLAGGSGIADLRIRVRSRWTDVLITGL
ncbi:MAG: hypothetical protein H0T50_05425, partial [Gemmatimonadales bacterium]|nr:hypothetical protein [Gemmatimonadales bacterium]